MGWGEGGAEGSVAKIAQQMLQSQGRLGQHPDVPTYTAHIRDAALGKPGPRCPRFPYVGSRGSLPRLSVNRRI